MTPLGTRGSKEQFQQLGPRPQVLPLTCSMQSSRYGLALLELDDADFLRALALEATGTAAPVAGRRAET